MKTTRRYHFFHRGKKGKKSGVDYHIWRHNGCQFSITDENYKPTDSKSSINTKHKKHGENYAKAYLSHIGQNQG